MSVDIVDDGFPTVFFVDLIPVADCVNNRQTETHVAFTKLVSVRLFDCVWSENKILNATLSFNLRHRKQGFLDDDRLIFHKWRWVVERG